MNDEERPVHCPACEGKSVARICYGLIRPNEELDRELKAGRIVLGGCFHFPEQWRCNDCSHAWQGAPTAADRWMTRLMETAEEYELPDDDEKDPPAGTSRPG